MVILRTIIVITALSLASCASQHTTLYDKIGGQKTITQVVGYFIDEIQFNASIFKYFEETDVDRFREKLTEHLCVVTGGPCQYSGDSMQQVHEGMQITETDFNITVDLLINAMNKAQISHQDQNRILQQLAQLRGEIIYL